jgi:hypothetical protein
MAIDPWDGWESADDLIAYAASAGFDITRTQLVRWHKAGLIPRPKTRYQPGRRGAETIYPPGTSAVLLEVCLLQLPRQPLEVTRWRLWWSDNEQDMADIRRILGEFCTEFDKTFATMRKLLRSNKRLPSSKWTFRGYLNRSPELAAPLGTIRRRLNWGSRQEFERFVDLLLGAVLGDETPLSDNDAEIFDRALRFDQARRVPLHGSTDWMPMSAGSAFPWMARFASEPLRDKLDRLSDEELIAARDEARDFITWAISFGEIMQWLFGRWGLGFGFLARALQRVVADAKSQAFMLLVFQAAKHDPELGEGLETLRPTFDEWNTTGYPNWKRLMFLADQLPSIRPMLTPERFRAAFKSPRGNEANEADIRAFRKVHAAEIDAVIAAHPEVFPPKEEELPVEPST